MFKFYDVQQNSEEWDLLRVGCLNGSKLGIVMANFGKAFGDPAKKYAVDIAIGQITGKPISNNYTNDHMERGHIQEPIARQMYEEQNFCEVLNGGFFGNGKIGCSPDGRVSSNGLIEIKSVIPSVHFDNIKRQGIDPSYKWQVYGNLKFTGKEWIDFVSYCQDFPDGKKLYQYRVYSKNLVDEFKQIDLRVSEFMELVQSTKETILNSNYFLN